MFFDFEQCMESWNRLGLPKLLPWLLALHALSEAAYVTDYVMFA